MLTNFFDTKIIKRKIKKSKDDQSERCLIIYFFLMDLSGLLEKMFF